MAKVGFTKKLGGKEMLCWTEDTLIGVYVLYGI